VAEYAILIYAPTGRAGEEPAGGQAVAERSRGSRSKHDRHSDDLARSGTMVAAFALSPAATALRGPAGDIVTDGPFIETKEVIVGFYVIEAPDLEAALAVARETRSSAMVAGSRSGPSQEVASSPVRMAANACSKTIVVRDQVGDLTPFRFELRSQRPLVRGSQRVHLVRQAHFDPSDAACFDRLADVALPGS
jgi:hypothetical protein